MILAALLAAVLASSPAIPQAREHDAVIGQFVTGLQSGRVHALNPLTVPGVNPQSWWNIWEVFDKHRCVTVSSYSWLVVDPGAGLVRLDLTGEGDVVGFRHEVRPLPSVWFLTFRQTPDGPRIADVEEEAHRVGRMMLDATDDRAREAVLDRHPGVPLRDVVRGIGDNERHYRFTDGDAPAWRDALYFVLGEATAANDDASESDALSQLANLAMMRSGNPATTAVMRALHQTEAAKLGSLAVDAAEHSGDCDVIAVARFRFGNLLAWQGDLASGNRQLEVVVAMGDQLHDGRTALKALVNWKAYSFREGDLRAALEGVELLSKRASDYGWAEGEISPSWTRGDIQAAVGDYPSAHRSYQTVMAGYKAVGNLERASAAAYDLAEIERRMGRIADAIATQTEAIALSREGGLISERGMAPHALLLIEDGRLDEAGRILQTIDQHHPPDALVSVADSQAWAAYWLARHDYERALLEARRVEPLHDDDRTWKGRTLAARALRGLGRNDEAIQELLNAITTIEEHRSRLPSNELGRARYFESRLEPYRELVDLYFSLDRCEAALRTAEWLKARSLLDTVTIARTDLSDSLAESEKRRLEELSSAIDDLNRGLAVERQPARRAVLENERSSVRRELEQFNDEMAIRHPVGTGVRASEVAVDLEVHVPSQSVAIVEYMVMPQSTIVLVAFRGPDDRVVVRGDRISVTSSDLSNRVQGLRDAIDTRAIGSKDLARELYDLLLAPIDRWLVPRDTLVIVPDGPLWQVPFAALERPSTRPLIMDNAVVYCPSLAAFRGLRRPRTSRLRSILAMGDASAGDRTPSPARAVRASLPLGKLPHAAAEVRAIVGQYGAGSAVYVGDAATETRLKSSVEHYEIVHLATHAVADSRWPMFSAILLTPTAEDDGILEAREVADLKLDADLAVLSACDTGQGKVLSGEGIIGLAWAFLSAGCPNTVVSQWSADSKATGKQMVEFHRRLLTGDSIPQALRQAQLQLRKNPRYADPFYWAAFVVIGQGQ